MEGFRGLLVFFAAMAVSVSTLAQPASSEADNKEKTAKSAKPSAKAKAKKKQNWDFQASEFKEPLELGLPPDFKPDPVQKIVYDLNQGKVLVVGPLKLKASDIRWSWADVPGPVVGKERNESGFIMGFRWPQELLKAGNLSLKNAKGEVLWEEDIDAGDLKQWQAWTKANSKWFAGKHPVLDADFGVFDFSFPEEMKKADGLKFCLRQQVDSEYTEICSGGHDMVRQAKKHQIRLAQPVTGQVEVNRAKTSDKGIISVSKKTQAKFTFASGATLEFRVKEDPIKYHSVFYDTTGKQLKIVGEGLFPGFAESAKKMNLPDTSMFAATIYDDRPQWKLEIPAAQRYFYVKGRAGAPLLQRFEAQNIPREDKLPPKLYYRTPEATYLSDPEVYVYIPSSKKPDGSNPEHLEKTFYRWTLKAPKKGEYNKTEMTLRQSSARMRYYHDIYRGFPGEASLRLTGVVDNDANSAILGEVAAGYWFESLFGWKNYYMSYQRWGVTARYFQSLVSVSGDKLVGLNVANIDFKYRFTPGLWNRDESWGLILGYQDMKLEKVKGSALATGLFWSRSMPRVFDVFFNVVPWLRYPKYVDAEFLYYVSPMSSDVELGNNLALNFHGKIYWTPAFFGEAGFGFKQFDYINRSQLLSATLNVLYGTAGLGYNF